MSQKAHALFNIIFQCLVADWNHSFGSCHCSLFQKWQLLLCFSVNRFYTKCHMQFPSRKVFLHQIQITMYGNENRIWDQQISRLSALITTPFADVAILNGYSTRYSSCKIDCTIDFVVRCWYIWTHPDCSFPYYSEVPKIGFRPYELCRNTRFSLLLFLHFTWFCFSTQQLLQGHTHPLKLD